MRKAWEALALFVIFIILIGIISDAITPYMPLIGIVTAGLVLLAVTVLLVRVMIARRKFW